MPIVSVSELSHEGLQVYAQLTEAQLRNRLDPERGIFIAESPKVIRTALQAGYEPLSLLCEAKHLQGDAKDLVAQLGDVPIYVGERQLLAQLTGYTLTRGVLCAMRRKALPTLTALCQEAKRIVVIEGVVDATNIGAIFRSAAALNIDALVLTPTACDPLNRRAIRVSMGSVFLVPWTWADSPWSVLQQQGFTVLAIALSDKAIALDDPRLKELERMAIVMGTEGDGLLPQTIASADHVVRIPMAHGVDSLNVAAAAALAFWELRVK